MLRRRSGFLYVFAALAATAGAPLGAHEAWIEPLDYTVAPGERFQAHLKVGQNFKGSTFPFIPDFFRFFDVIDTDGRRPVPGRTGDMPAVTMNAGGDGLMVLSFRSTINQVKYEEWEKFETFIRNHGLDALLERHRERGLPETGFIEAYFRFSKTLVSVGSGQGQDVVTGLPYELVALTNPYAGGAMMRYRLLWNGAPQAGNVVHVFRRGDSSAEAVKTSYTTDAEGTITFPVSDGGEYLVNAVHIIEPTPEFHAETQAVWVSLWASETFRVE